MSSNFVKIPPSFEKKNEVVEERIVSNDSGVIYLVNMDKDKIIPPEERAISAFADKMGNSIWKTADGILHFKIKSSGRIGILGKIGLFEFQNELAHNYGYDMENFVKDKGL